MKTLWKNLMNDIKYYVLLIILLHEKRKTTDKNLWFIDNFHN